MNNYTRHKLLAAPGFLLVCFVVLEIAVRLISHQDADSNRWFGGTRLKPYRLPVRRTTQLVQEYTIAESRKLIYDAEVGWAPQPGRNGNNAQGFYSISPDTDLAPPTNRLRVAIFGASYTAGHFETGWWRTLEKALNDAGVAAEVFNFGVGGYAMDQAFLRWRKSGAAYHPHIVIFGFTRQNCENNLNLLRIVAEPDTGIPFMKPRFLLEHEQLKLINTPTPIPEALPGIVARFSEWPLARHEQHFKAEDFQASLWRHSSLFALFEARIGAARDRAATASFYQEDGEAGRLAVKIISQFRQEAEAVGSRFYVLHLPSESDLRTFQATGNYPFAGLLNAVNRIATVIQPETAMLTAARGHDLARYFNDGHYTNEFNPAIGAAVAEALLANPDMDRYRARK